MKQGTLRHRLTIETPTQSQNAIGESVPAYAAAFQRWGAVEELRGDEIISAQQTTPVATAKIRVRHESTIVPNSRITGRVGGRARTWYVVASANPDHRNAALELLAREDI